MARGLTPNETIDYVLKSDRELPEEEQTVFHLRTPTFQERTELENVLEVSSETGQLTVRTGTAKARCLKACLRGWTNFMDVDGKQIDFEKSPTPSKPLNGQQVLAPTPNTLGRLTAAQATELCDAITESMHLTNEQKKT